MKGKLLTSFHQWLDSLVFADFAKLANKAGPFLVYFEEFVWPLLLVIQRRDTLDRVLLRYR